MDHRNVIKRWKKRHRTAKTTLEYAPGTEKPCTGETTPSNCHQCSFCDGEKNAQVLHCSSKSVYNHTSRDSVRPKRARKNEAFNVKVERCEFLYPRVGPFKYTGFSNKDYRCEKNHIELTATCKKYLEGCTNLKYVGTCATPLPTTTSPTESSTEITVESASESITESITESTTEPSTASSSVST
ncbi:uncharacterized protein LOC129748981 [Uranotaenia lowii]|uniref:uncharacterized protein LOC129748981 n=1 Tax=Uranotaenia lowii TaxID=190385 RepID=UPI0024784CDF|nr:uncharacterized protein LOC129748981 [Uranotaenia lowii]